MLHDKENNIMRANLAYKELCGVGSFEEIVGKPYWHFFPKLEEPMKTCSESIHTGKVAEEEFVLEDGRIFKSRTYPVYDDDGKYSFGIHLFEDITKFRAQELRIISLNKTLRLISKCNEHLVRSKSEQKLLANICDEIVNSDEYEFSAIYLKDETSIKCSYLSSEIDTLSNIKEVDLSYEKYSGCPVVVCIEQNRIIIINDVHNDPEWSAYMKKHTEICPATPYDMQGSMMMLPLENSIKSFGALLIYSKQLNIFNEEKNSLFQELAGDTSYGIHTLRLRKRFEDVSMDNKTMLTQLHESLDGTIKSVAMMVEARDPYTAGHQNRVSDLAVSIAKKMGLDEKRIEGLRLGGLVHDIGKIKIPAEILSKPTKLTNLEYEMIKTHPQVGYDILKEIKFPWPIAQMIYQHHERIDGSGYPNGLKGEELLLESKILTVADVVEAIASHRPYRAALGIGFALEEIEKYKGVFYDADVVNACIKLFKEDGYVLPENPTL